MATAQIVADRLWFSAARAFVGDLETLVAAVDLHHVPLLGEFDAVFVRELIEPPEQRSDAFRLSQMKAVAAAFLADIWTFR